MSIKKSFLLVVITALLVSVLAPSAALAADRPARGVAESTASSSAVPPPIGNDGPGAKPPAGLARGAVEVLEERTEFSKTFVNPDGTESTTISLTPLHFDEAGAWADIDTSVVPDPSIPHGFQSSANEWTARFAPLPAGLTIETVDGPVSFAPVGAAAVAPEELADGTGVVYRNAWPGVDLRYEVLADGVKEDIVLTAPPTVTHFDFTTGRQTFGAVGEVLRPLAGGDALGALMPPEVVDASGRLLDRARPAIRSILRLLRSSTLRFSFDQAYLRTLPASAYPISLDPTWASGSSNMTAYKSDGTTCSGCGLKVGNSDETVGNRYWRSVGYFDYAPLMGRQVTNAVLSISNRQFGTANGHALDVNWASAYSYAGAVGVGPYASAVVGDSATFGGANLTALYNYFTSNSVAGGALGFVGAQPSGLYTYKSFSSYTLTLTYPGTVSSAPSNVVATDNNDGNVTLSWNPPSNNGGSAITGYVLRRWPSSANPATAAPQATLTCSATCSPKVWGSLAEGSSWRFGVSAVNAVGEGPVTYSGVVTIRRFPGAPTGLLAHAGNQQALVTWSAAPTNGGPAIDSYLVAAFHPTNANLHRFETVCGTCLSHVLVGLANNVQYVVAVRAHNPNGYGATYPSTTVTPAVNAVPYPVQFQGASPGNGSAMVTWLAPKPNGGPAVTGYVVQLWQGATFVTQTGILPATGVHNRYHWTGLTNGTTYTFRIYPYGSYFGPEAVTNPVTPSSNPTPFPVRNPQVTSGAGAALIVWQGPESGPLPNHYVIQLFRENGTFVLQQQTVSGFDVATLLLGLESGTTYLAAIYSAGSTGYSAPVVTAPFTSGIGNLLTATSVTATRGDTNATVTWQPPTTALPGLTSYTVTAYRSSDGASVATATTTSTSTQVTGLRNGTPVHFRVVATNLVLPGPASAPSNTVVPAGVPFAPTSVGVGVGDTAINVTWSPPAARPDGTPGDNGDPITGYQVVTHKASDGSVVSTTPVTGTQTPVTGLLNGTAYYVKVLAVNAVGNGELSTQSATVIPAGRPFAPVNVQAVATAQLGQVLVRWDPPPARPNGTPGHNGSPITQYTVTASPGGQTATVDGTTTQKVMTVPVGSTSNFSVTATNAIGTGPSSASSNSYTAAGAPAAPVGVTATLGDTYITVQWSAPPTRPDGTPGDGGSTIDRYTVTASPGGVTATTTGATTVDMGPGLEAGNTYSFTVTARNAYGTSPASAPSNAVDTPPCEDEGEGFQASEMQLAAASIPWPWHTCSPTITCPDGSEIPCTPSAPTNVVATAGTEFGTAHVEWTGSNTRGVQPVTYTVTASPGGATATSPTPEAEVPGLVGGTTYTFTVVAQTQGGTSPASAPSAPFTLGDDWDRNDPRFQRIVTLTQQIEAGQEPVGNPDDCTGSQENVTCYEPIRTIDLPPSSPSCTTYDICRVGVHEELAGPVSMLLEVIQQRGYTHLLRFVGGYNTRQCRNDSGWVPGCYSNHGIGVAIDIMEASYYDRDGNYANWNQLVDTDPAVPRLIELFADFGYAWGGNFRQNGSGFFDAIHFEFVGLVAAEEDYAVSVGRNFRP